MTPPGRTLISSRRIKRRIRELAEEIRVHYRHREPLTVIAIMHGSLFFFADLIRLLPAKLEIECWNISSYKGKTSTGTVQGLQSHKRSYRGRYVLLVDDIFDTGLTLDSVIRHVKTLHAKEIRTCVLLSKKVDRSKEIVPPDWVGFEIPNRFVVGYGLDLDQHYRPLPMIRVLD